MAFARCFQHVHAFEPNPDLWANFERNMQLNGFGNVTLHRVGLGESNSHLPFHVVDNPNRGLGTFATIEQYDLPLKRKAVCPVVNGDDYLRLTAVDDIDAVKIDVQGFEPMVLRGLAGTLARYRPIIWFELSAGTQGTADMGREISRILPFSSEVLRLSVSRTWLLATAHLDFAEQTLALGDYVIVPR
jgi:FkbM family methyltransferase